MRKSVQDCTLPKVFSDGAQKMLIGFVRVSKAFRRWCRSTMHRWQLVSLLSALIGLGFRTQ
jgi:hypothetical protein